MKRYVFSPLTVFSIILVCMIGCGETGGVDAVKLCGSVDDFVDESAVNAVAQGVASRGLGTSGAGAQIVANAQQQAWENARKAHAKCIADQ